MKIRVIDASNVELRQQIKEVGVDTRAVENLLNKATHYVLKIEGINTRQAIIMKQSALSVGADAAVPKEVLQLKDEKMDVLLFGTWKQLQSLSGKLKEQEFGLKELAEHIEATINHYRSLPYLLLKDKKISFKRPLIMGILNVTPDSFWDGGRYIEVREALKRAERLLEEGADILDVGAESTRPGAEPVPKEEELRRLLPILKEVVKWGIIISVDTYKRDVARECLSMGVHMINDVKALRDEGMAECVAEHGAAVVLMHMRGEPKTMQKDVEYTDVVSQLLDYLKERVDYAQSKGIRRECIVIDPGIGFGKRLLHNLQLLARLGEFKIIERPIMIGVSRKSFIGEVLNLPVEERLEGTLAAVAVAVMKGANILRVHDVKEAKRVIQIVNAIKGVYEGE